MLLRSHLRYADGIPARSYSHFCAIARALDALGERWSLLLLREMFFGPKRFTDLQQGLPGIGTGVLSQRLRELEQDGVIARRRLPPPAASVVYELTESGRAVDPILVALARWGMDRLDEPRPDDAFRVLWAMNGMRTLFDAEAAAGLRETYEFCIGDEHFHVRIDDGRVEVLDGPADDAVLRICSDADTFLAALSSTRAPDRSGLVVEGDRGALERCRRVFAPTVPALARRSSDAALEAPASS